MQSKDNFIRSAGFLIGLLFFFFSSPLYAASHAQWRGVLRNGVYQDQDLLKTWPKDGLEMIWSQTGIGYGHSSVVGSNGTLYVTGTQDTTDYISALTKDGKKLWKIPFARAWDQMYPEARCTPTVAEGKVYLISSHGKVMRIDGASSQIDWQIDAYAQFEGQFGIWGTSESPLVVDDKVIYTPGGSSTMIVALHKDTGDTVWQSSSLNDTTAYVSPIVVNYAGKQMIIGISANYVYGLDAKDGNFLWTYDYKDQLSMLMACFTVTLKSVVISQ